MVLLTSFDSSSKGLCCPPVRGRRSKTLSVWDSEASLGVQGGEAVCALLLRWSPELLPVRSSPFVSAGCYVQRRSSPGPFLALQSAPALCEQMTFWAERAVSWQGSQVGGEMGPGLSDPIGLA